MSIPPLHKQIPIVDNAGRPTPQFMEIWERLRRLVADVPDVAGTYGTPTSITVNEQGKITDIA